MYVFPRFFNADQLNNSWIPSVHFAIFTVISAVFFRVHESLPHLEQMRWQIFGILFLAIVFVLGTSFYNSWNVLSEKAHLAILTSKLYYPLFTVQTTIPKVFDVVFQQITIFGFIKYLLSKDFQKKEVLLIMWLAFALLHSPLMLKEPVYWVTLFLPSFFAGLPFTYIILYLKHGLAYSFAVHFIFYFLTGVALRTFYSY